MNTDLLLYANYYHNLGMNITHLSGNHNKSYKEPTDQQWQEYITKKQNIEYLNAQQWDEATGLGIVLGYNQYRAIDVDDFFYKPLIADEEYEIMGLIREDQLWEFIQTCLELLKLPNDYSWVVKSGSGHGCHIIIKVEDIQNFDVSAVPYAPNSKHTSTNDNNFVDWASFRRMELRWKDHLVLPPSIHKTGNKYEFYHKNLPNYAPIEVSIENLNNLLNYYCGEEEYSNYNYNDKKLYLTRLKKQMANHDSWIFRLGYETIEDNLNWLLKCNSSEALNSLGIAYVLGKGVQVDNKKAKSYFELSNNSHAHFNLANLIACGYIDENIEDVNRHLSFCEDCPYEYKELIKTNALNTLSKNKTSYYLFFDTETTGVPSNYEALMNDLKNWPRLVQIAWIACDEKGNIIESAEHIIKPNGFIIPKDVVCLHGISTEKAISEGKEIKDVLGAFTKLVRESNYLVGHNVHFDINVVGAELIRANMNCIVQNKNFICTMKSSVNFCALAGKYYGYRYPKLEELYFILFRKPLINAHSAMADIIATKNCFFELKKRNIIAG